MLTKKIFFLVNYIEFYILEKVCQLEGETGIISKKKSIL